MATWRRISLSIVGVALLAAGPAAANGQLTLSITPSSTAVDAGTSFSVDIAISGLGNFTSPSLGAFDLDIGFDPAVVDPTTVVFTTLLGDEGLGEAISSSGVIGPGQLDLSLLSLLTAAELDALQPGQFVLATVSFDALAPGTSPLALSIQGLADADGNALEAATSDGSILVRGAVAAPMPSTVALLAAGGALAGWMSRQRWHVR